MKAGWGVLPALLVTAVYSTAAWADDCQSRCSGSYCGATDQSGYWKCEDDRRSCIASCLSSQDSGGSTNGSSSNAPRGPRFGAIAYDFGTGGYGYSYGMTTVNQADGRAMAECSARNSRCEVVVEVQNECGAVAGGEGGRFSWGKGANRQKAESDALAECGRHMRNCEIKVWVCSGS